MAEYIEREALLSFIDAATDNSGMGYVVARTLKRFVKRQPAADVEPVRHGRWIPQVVLGQKAWDCSECKTLGSPYWKRCPLWEAKMDLKDGKE